MLTASDELTRQWNRVVDTVKSVQLGHNDSAQSVVTRAVPVTILTGFLGAGKTTLLKRLLTQPHGLRVTAIVNDLSPLAFDANEVSGAAESTIALNNGCACCSLIGDLQETLRAQVDASSDAVPDAIVIELSGVTDAVGVAQLVESLDFLKLDGVVTVVDSFAAAEQLDSQLAPTLRSQLDAAHLIALSKTDLVDEDTVSKLSNRLGHIAPGRPIVQTSSDLDVDVMLGCAQRGARLPPQAKSHGVAFHDRVVTIDKRHSRRDFEELLAALPSTVLRAKGQIRFSDNAAAEVQMVGRRWTMTDAPSTVSKSSALALIGTDPEELDCAARILGCAES